MKLLVFVVDGRIIKCHHITFINLQIYEKGYPTVLILGDADFKEIETIMAREVLNIQYEDKEEQC